LTIVTFVGVKYAMRRKRLRRILPDESNQPNNSSTSTSNSRPTNNRAPNNRPTLNIQNTLTDVDV